MTAATPGLPPRDHRDGLVTLGQAPEAPFRVWMHEVGHDPDDMRTYFGVGAMAEAFQGGTQAAIAAQPQPAPGDVEAAFASGARVRTAPCPAAAHDREHFQVRTGGHWLCGHLLASLLIAQGIAADPGPQPAPELAAAMAALAEYERYAERGTVPNSAARLAIRKRAGLETLT